MILCIHTMCACFLFRCDLRQEGSLFLVATCLHSLWGFPSILSLKTFHPTQAFSEAVTRAHCAQEIRLWPPPRYTLAIAVANLVAFFIHVLHITR